MTDAIPIMDARLLPHALLVTPLVGGCWPVDDVAPPGDEADQREHEGMSPRRVLFATVIALMAAACSTTAQDGTSERGQQLDITVIGDLERDLQLTQVRAASAYRVEAGTSPAEAWNEYPAPPEFTFESEDGSTSVTVRLVRRDGVVVVQPGVLPPLEFVIHLDRALVKPGDEGCVQSFDSPESLTVTGTLTCSSVTALLPGADELPHIDQLDLSFTYTVPTCDAGAGTCTGSG